MRMHPKTYVNALTGLAVVALMVCGATSGLVGSQAGPAGSAPSSLGFFDWLFSWARGGGASSQPSTYRPLWIPPMLEGSRAEGVTSYDLTLSTSTKSLMSGSATATYGYNGSEFWGPTLVLNRGDVAQMTVRNTLAEATTTHWHGLLVAGPVDGGPHQMVAAGGTWTTPMFRVKNRAATYWYHPHMHTTTQKQLTLGAGGFIIIRDDEEAALALPRTYGVDDIPLVLTSRRFTTTNGVANQFQYTTTAYGDYALANGTLNAAVTLPKQVVRLRVLNAEIERDYNLGFSDGRSFQVIGSDGGLLGAPVSVTRVVMAPGERYELLVDLGADAQGSSLDLMAYNGAGQGLSFGFAGYEPATSGEFGSLLNAKNFPLLRINVGAATADGVRTAPTSLVSQAALAEVTLDAATQSRAVSITGGVPPPFTFDGRSFAHDYVNQFVSRGTTEAWTINAGGIFSHSFHIHGVQFRIVARNGSPSQVKAYEQGWKDTFYLPIRETVTFVARFDEVADETYPYMYHCHMTNHEDEGLMGQFTVR